MSKNVLGFVVVCVASIVLAVAVEYVYAGNCDSDCDVATLSKLACKDTKWDPSGGKDGKGGCESAGKGGNCSSGGSETDCSGCVCAPSGKVADYKKDDACYCHSSGY